MSPFVVTMPCLIVADARMSAVPVPSAATWPVAFGGTPVEIGASASAAIQPALSVPGSPVVPAMIVSGVVLRNPPGTPWM